MGLDRLRGIFGSDNTGDDPNIDSTEEDFYGVPEKGSNNNEKETSDNAAGSKMILLEPRAYSEAQKIADHLKHKDSVVVNLKRVTSDQAKRIIDFLSGCVYAISGKMQKVGVGIYLCTPKNVNVLGEISEDNKAADKNGNDDEVEW